MNDYSQIIYESKTFRLKHPDYIAAVSFLLGHPKLDIANSQILAVGCGTGRGLIPLAYELTNATIMGIDPQKRPLELGENLIKNCSIDNLNLSNIAITELPSQYYDIVLVHGVYSWIATEEREKLCKNLKAKLKNNGILVVSHNVLPGWRVRETIRDYIKILPGYATTQDINEKLSIVRSFLSQCTKIINYESEQLLLLSNEIKRLNSEPDHYLYHELMNDLTDGETLNTFVQPFVKQGLKYIGDTLWTRMPIINETSSPFGDKLEDILSWYDLTHGQAFRESLFVSSDTFIACNQFKNRLKDCFFATYLEELEHEPGTTICIMKDLRDRIITLDTLYEKDLTDTLSARWPNFVSWHELINTTGLQDDKLTESLSTLVRRGIVIPSLLPPTIGCGMSSNNFQTFPWVAFQIAEGLKLTNGHYDTVEIGGFEEVLLQGMITGHSSLEELVSFLKHEIKNRGASETPDTDALKSVIMEGMETLNKAALIVQREKGGNALINLKKSKIY
jgi:SAM-dependent methyltransferase